MNVYRDIKRIIDQIRGKRNMFEYQTTIANQAYLMYILLGKIYTTDKIHRHTKSLFITGFTSIILLAIAETIFYFLFYIHEDLLTQMYASFTVFCAALMVTIVIMSHTHRHLIESTIAMIDKFVATDPIIDSYIGVERIDTKVVLYVPILYLSSLLPFLLFCMADVAIFYDESKVKSNIYYLIPLPKLEQYGSLGFYVIFNIVCTTLGCTVIFTYITMMILPLTWVVVCHNEVQRIVQDLSSLNQDDHVTAKFNISESNFRSTIIRCVHAYRDVIKAVEYFRGYYEIMANILLPVLLFMGVVHVYILTTTTHSYIVMLKEFSIFFALLQIVYTYCWVGETLDEMTDTMSFAVYSTPWYMSTKVRKDVYIFLCQTQNSINPAAWSVYPLSLATFLRFMNVVQSSVNILRAVSTK